MPLSIAAVNPSEVIITGPQTLSDWRTDHTMPVPGREFMPRFRRHVWDGLWTPGKWCRQNGEQFDLNCSRGLLPRIVKDLGGALEFDLSTPEQVEAFRADHPKIEQFRDFQKEAFDVIVKEGWGRVAYATNAGKGAVIAMLAAFSWYHKRPTLILCDELAVFDALLGELRAWGGIEPNIVKAGVKVPPRNGVTLAMVPTLARRVSDEAGTKIKDKPWHAWLLSQQMLLLDEADKADAASWRSIMTAAKNTTWRAGFSGSFPKDEYDNLRLDELMGPIAVHVGNKAMVERGISARPTIEVHAFEATPALQNLSPEWWTMTGAEKRKSVYDRAVIYNQERHEFIATLVTAGTPTAVVVNRIDHGRDLANVLTNVLGRAVFLDGSTSESERLDALDAFREGRITILVVTKILDRGTNRLGHAADLIFASAEGSASQILQRIGRGLRRADGKAYLRLVDVVDRVAAPKSDKRMKMAGEFLRKAAKRRLQVYAQEGFDVQIIPH